ncbi:extracellular solute-binding protein [Candidatus Babeliales bacterium]|nr:extracellular solute-binding protein [Candidatus Babeliales bacterium]
MNKNHTKFEKFGVFFFYFSLISMFLALPHLFEKKQGLTVYTYANLIPYEVFHDFEKKTGIPVRVKLFSSNEEMFAKIKIDKSSQYDLIVPADYMVEILHEEGLLHEINTDLITNLGSINHHLLNKSFDLKNKYSLPLVYILYGLGYNKSIFGEKLSHNSWEMVFNVPHKNNKRPDYFISMLDDGREAFFLASLYLYGKVNGLSKKEIEAVKAVLIKQWDWVENYANANQPFYLQSGLVPIIVVTNDIMANLLRNYDNEYGFSIPEEGSIMSIENLVVSKTCKNINKVHALIDHILSEGSARQIVLKYGLYPSNVTVFEKIKKGEFGKSIPIVSDADMNKAHLLDNSISIETYSKMWLQVKSSIMQKR